MSRSRTVNYLASSHLSLIGFSGESLGAGGGGSELLTPQERQRGGRIISSQAISFPSLSRPGLQGATRCGAGNKGPLLHSAFGWGWVWGPETGGHFNGAVQPGV